MIAVICPRLERDSQKEIVHNSTSVVPCELPVKNVSTTVLNRLGVALPVLSDICLNGELALAL